MDTDHLDTAVHFQGLDSPVVAPADMAELVRRFGELEIQQIASGLVRFAA